jgi:hypothetical protein
MPDFRSPFAPYASFAVKKFWFSDSGDSARSRRFRRLNHHCLLFSLLQFNRLLEIVH